MSDIKISSQPLGARSGIMKLAGHLDSNTFETLEDEINKLLESGLIGLAVDFSKLESASSAGLGVFANLATLLRDRKGMFKMVAPSVEVAGIVDMLGLRDFFEVTETMEQAKRELSSLH